MAKYLHMKKMKRRKVSSTAVQREIFFHSLQPSLQYSPVVIFIRRWLWDEHNECDESLLFTYFSLPPTNISKESSTQNPSATRMLIIKSIHFVFKAEKWKMQATAATRTLSGWSTYDDEFSSLPFDGCLWWHIFMSLQKKTLFP